jgi:hypothetical protein
LVVVAVFLPWVKIHLFQGQASQQLPLLAVVVVTRMEEMAVLADQAVEHQLLVLLVPAQKAKVMQVEMVAE